MEKSISKEYLKEMLKKIETATYKQKDVLEKCTVSQKDLDRVKSNALIEITRLDGEKRAVAYLLSTLEPPKEAEKKEL